MSFPRLLVKPLFILALVVPGLDLAAQSNPTIDINGHVGIGTVKPDPLAILDLNSTTAGLLMPRLTAAQIAALVNPPTGLMVFNTTTGEFNYNFGAPGTPQWEALLTLNGPSAGSAFWKLSGNALTTGDFLGSTNSQPLILKTDNTERMRITAAGNVGIGTPSPGQPLDVAGNIQFSGALMPAGDPGEIAEILVSSGPGFPPTWQPAGAFSFDGDITGPIASTVIDPENPGIGDRLIAGVNNGTTMINDARVNDTLTINGGTIDNTPIGATGRSTGAFTSVDVTGNAIVGGDVIATDDIEAGDNVRATNDVTAGDDMEADDDITAGDDINAGGDVVVGQDVDVDGEINVQNDVNVGGDLFVDGNMAIDGDVTLGNGDNDPITFNAGTGAVTFSGSVINGVGTPIVGTDAANKDYVDNQITSQAWALDGNAAGATDVLGTTNAQDLNIIAGGSTRMTIDDETGNVGVGGAASATDRLSVTGNINTSTQYNIGGERVLSVPGTENLFVGAGAGTANTTGTNNTFVGDNAGLANTAGLYNTVVGSDALSENTTGNNNTVMGFGAMAANTTGEGNTSIGQRTLEASTTGDYNTAVGMGAMIENETGRTNTAIGVSALNTNTTGDENTAVGSGAMNGNLTGDNSTGIGVNALSGYQSGSNNTALGKEAGFDAPFTSTGTGSNNTFIGYQANPSAFDLNNATAIGAGAIVGQSNALVLGNNADVGIGTSTPGARLDVAGTAGTSNVRMGSLSGAAVSTPWTPTADDGIVVADANGDLLKRSLEEVIPAAGWELTGNAGTTPGTNFLGTTDDTPMEIRVNDTAVMRYFPNATSPNIIGGVYENTIDTGSYGSIIAAGGSATEPNAIDTSAIYSTIGGGRGNFMSADDATIGGGDGNTITGNSTAAAIAGGESNTIQFSANHGAIGGGRLNTIGGAAQRATIGGGDSNTVTASAGDATIGGGRHNTINNGSLSAVIGGGDSNTISNSSNQGTIGGGRHNTINNGSLSAVIGGGDSNTISNGSNQGTIGGGRHNMLTNGGEFGTIGGGATNTVTNGAANAVIGGGVGNTITDGTTNGTIAGGTLNRIASGVYGAIGGGRSNTITSGAERSTIAGGDSNTINNNAAYSTIGGGRFNTVTNGAERSTIAGGDSNTISSGAFHGVIGGGRYNTITNGARLSTIGGGDSNMIASSAVYGMIGGGRRNTITNGAEYSTIGGGDSNMVSNSSVRSTIGGGRYNAITNSADRSTIGGGVNNTITNSAFRSTIGGGDSNLISNSASRSTIGGGGLNTVSDGSVSGTVAGGTVNRVLSSSYGTIGGGDSNMVAFSANHSVIDGGHGNVVNNGSSYSAIGGGQTNTVTSGSDRSTIGGGVNNTLTGSSNHGTIGGGAGNTLSGGSTYGAIAGGRGNSIIDGSDHGTIGGGDSNTITDGSDYAAIGGGQGNRIDSMATHSVIGGGQGNRIDSMATHSAIGGGADNAIYGSHSVIPGGRGMTLDGARSFGFNANDMDGTAPMTILDSNVAVIANADLWLANNNESTGQIRFYESNVTSGEFPPAGINDTSFRAGSQADDITYTLPEAGPATDGDVLTAQPDGTMSWIGQDSIVKSYGWSLSGNAISGTEVLGTTNDQDLNIITGNTTRMTIDDETGNVGVGGAPSGIDKLSVTGNINSSTQYNIGGNAVLQINGATNVATGVGAGAAVTSGANNTSNGTNALAANTTGSNNIAIGSNALQSSTTTSNNTAVGHNAMRLNTTGTNNLAVGRNALAANTTGNSNTALGPAALLANTTGGDNVAVGRNSLAANTTGESNTGVGVSALGSNTIGRNNTALGRNALNDNTEGRDNTAVGRNAMSSNIIGEANTAVGRESLVQNLTGSGNTAIGIASLASNVAGNVNTAVGAGALTSSTIGEGNTAVGAGALASNDDGSGNVAVGGGAMFDNTSGFANVAVGTDALGFNTIGTGNTVIGATAMAISTISNLNTAVGSSALLQNTEGSSNVALGSFALSGTSIGEGNTGVGTGAGSFNDDGSFNTFIGQGADAASPGLINATAIGAGAVVAQDSSLILGNEANVGIGTSTPAARLHVEGTAGTSNVRMGSLSGEAIADTWTPTADDGIITADANGDLIKRSLSAIGGGNGNGGNSVAYAPASTQETAPDRTAYLFDIAYDPGAPTSVDAVGARIISSAGMGDAASATALTLIAVPSGPGSAIALDAVGNINTDRQYDIGYSRVLSVTGTNNLLVGLGAGAMDGGSENTFVGTNVGAQNTTGIQNTGIGALALSRNTTGVNNSAFGYNTLTNNTTGTNNTGLGTSSLAYSTTGDNNTALGLETMNLNTTGSNNTAVGMHALIGNTTGGDNTALGMNAGTVNVSGVNNTFLGAGANATFDSLVNATAVGSNAMVCQDSTLILGSDARVGIGTSTPTARLDVNGTFNVTDNATLGSDDVDSVIVNGVMDANATGNQLGDSTASAQLTIHGFQDATGEEGIVSGAYDLAVIGDIGATGIIKSGASIVINGLLDERVIGSDTALRVATTVGDLSLTGENINISTHDNGYLKVDEATSIEAPGYYHSFGSEGQDGNVMYIWGNSGEGENELTVFGDMQLTGNLEMRGAVRDDLGDMTIDDNADITGRLRVNGTESFMGDTTATTQLTIHGVANATGSELIPDPAYDLTVIGDIGATGIIKSGASIVIDGVSAERVIGADTALRVVTTEGDLSLTGENVNVSTLGNGSFFVDNGTSIYAPGNGHSMGLFMEDSRVLTISGSDGGQDELMVNGDVEVTGGLSVGTLGLEGDLDMEGHDILNVHAVQFNDEETGLSNLEGDLLVDDSLSVSGSLYAAETITAGEKYDLGETTVLATPGSFNVAVGPHALREVDGQGGERNTAVGVSALEKVTTGSNNTAVGESAGLNLTTGAFNTAVGGQALDEATTGNNNAAFGFNALAATTTGNGNTAFGTNALEGNTTADNNTAVGIAAMATNTTGADNTAVGATAMGANITGSGNAVLGANALASNTTGSNNVAVGSGSLGSSLAGMNNTAVGHDALDESMSGNDNTALGSSALGSLTTGADNVAVGSGALSSSAAGVNNVAVGRSAALNLTTGDGNVAVGMEALKEMNGSGNVAVGFGAGATPINGTGNTFIGQGADGADGLSDATAIGAGALVEQSNAIVLGDSDDDVAIGTTTPDERLEVMNGNILVSNDNDDAGSLMFMEPSSEGSNLTTFEAGAQSDDISYVLPVEQGAANSVMSNDGSGNLSWVLNGSTITMNVNSDYTNAGAFTTNQDNLDLDGSGSYFRIEANSAIDITGIASEANGRVIVLVNVGSQTITLKHNDAGSNPGNRFLLAGGNDFECAENSVVTLVYDEASSFWRIISVF